MQHIAGVNVLHGAQQLIHNVTLVYVLQDVRVDNSVQVGFYGKYELRSLEHY